MYFTLYLPTVISPTLHILFIHLPSTLCGLVIEIFVTKTKQTKYVYSVSANVTIILLTTCLGSGFEPSSDLIHEQDVDNFTVVIFKMKISYLHENTLHMYIQIHRGLSNTRSLHTHTYTHTHIYIYIYIHIYI